MPYPEPVGIGNFPSWLSSALGVNEVTGNVLAVLIVLIIFFLPMVMIKTYNFFIVVTSILLMSVLTSLGWLPIWTWVIIALYFAVKISGTLKGFF
jgi:hypothetical protein